MSNLHKFRSSEINVNTDNQPLSYAEIIEAIRIGVRMSEERSDFGIKPSVLRTLSRYGNDNGY